MGNLGSLVVATCLATTWSLTLAGVADAQGLGADHASVPGDRYTSVAASPVVSTGAPIVGSTTGGFTGSVNPQGLTTTAHFEYHLDSRYGSAGTVLSTPHQAVGSDTSSHDVTASVSALSPNALYHVRLVASNSAGTTIGPDRTFTTGRVPPPAPRRR
jgi:hypothetical protein